MKQMVARLFVAAILAGFLSTISSKAQAYSYGGGGSYGNENGWQVDPSLMYYFWTTSSNNNAPTTTNSRTLAKIDVGYHWGLFHLAGEYNYDQFQLSGGGNPTSSNIYNSYGLLVGLETDTLYLNFTYFIGSTFNQNQGLPSAFNYNNGNGFQVALGYMMDIGSGWSVGPEMDYRSLSYPSQSNQPSYTFTTLAPYITFRYKF
jgi:hypothetical protein